MLTIDQALKHLGFDEVDETIRANVTDALADAKSYLQEVVGDDVYDLLPDHTLADRLVRNYLTELYDERGTTSAKANNAKREMVQSMELQLRLKLAKKRAEAAKGASV